MHNRPLYFTALINGNEVRRALIDGGSSINVMLLATIEAAGISKDRIVEQIIEIAGFAAEGQATLGHITVDLEVGQIKKPTRFHVINTRPSYHILLGWPWIHKARAVPSSLHQCLKAVVNGKCVTIPASIMPFERREAHIVGAAFSEEAAPDGEATLTIPRSVHLPKWEEAQKGNFLPPRKRARSRALVETSGAEAESKQCIRIDLPNGRSVYRL